MEWIQKVWSYLLDILKRVGKIILLPWNLRLLKALAQIVKPVIGLGEFDSMKEWLQKSQKGKAK